jgi:hypothetical protein
MSIVNLKACGFAFSGGAAGKCICYVYRKHKIDFCLVY